VTLLPWLVWTHVQRVGSEAVGTDAFDPTHLWENRGRLAPAAAEVTTELLERLAAGWWQSPFSSS
jgi:hypothetical protein